MKRILAVFFVLIFMVGCGGGSSGGNSGESNTKPDSNTPINPTDPINNNPVTPPVKSSAKSITEFHFLPENNPGIIAAIYGEINNTNITLKVPATSNISGLVAAFKASDNAIVMTASGIQTSCISSNNFNVPVQYYVKAEDESIAIYTVTVIADAASNVAGWPKTFGGSLADEGKGIATDTAGNVFVTGYFRNSVDFDPGPNKDLKSSTGSADVFISKFNKDGSYAWTKTFGGADEDRGHSISVDKNGNIIISGSFNNTVDFNSGDSTDIKTAVGSNNIFVTKLNSDGSYVWTKTFTNNPFANNSVTTDSASNVYVAGSFSGSVDFNSGDSTDIKTAVGSNNIFVTKLNSDGSYSWTKIFSTNSISDCKITTDFTDNIFIAGSFSGTADFDLEGTHNIKSSTGSTDIFVTKLNSDGSYAWTKTFGGAGSDIGNAVTNDISGNVFITGSFTKTVDFDPAGNHDLKTDSSNNGYTGDVFVTRLNSDGSYAWTKTFSSTYTDSGNAIAINNNGNIIAIGSFSGTADFDPTGNHDYKSTTGTVSSSNADIFITYLSPAGDYIMTKTLGGVQEDSSKSIAADHDGNVFITGFFNDAADFDSGENEDIKNSQGFKDIFVLKAN